MKPLVAQLFMAAAAKSIWDDATKSTDITLDATGLIATHAAVAANGGARGTRARSGGKHYFEVTVSDVNGGQAGIADTAPGGALVGTLAAGWGYSYGNGRIRNNATDALTGLDTFTAGVVCVAVDLDNDLIWFRKSGGNWNGNASYSPGGTGGLAISAGSYYPACATSNAGTHTLNTGQAPFVGGLPSGFNIWE